MRPTTNKHKDPVWWTLLDSPNYTNLAALLQSMGVDQELIQTYLHDPKRNIPQSLQKRLNGCAMGQRLMAGIH